MNNDEQRSKLRDVEPIGPAPEAGDAEERIDVDDVAAAGAAGSTGIPAVGVIAEADVPPEDNPEVDAEARR